MSVKDLIQALYEKDPTSFVTLEDLTNVERVLTISPSVNYVLGGGLVPAKFYGFAGPPSSGKSMFALSCTLELLKRDPEAHAFWFDFEQSFTLHWFDIFLTPEEKETVVPRLHIKNCSFFRDAFDFFVDDIQDAIIKGLKVTACVVDSVQSIMSPPEESAESSEKTIMAGIARFLPPAMRRVTDPSRKYGVTWFFINQVRDNMDMFTNVAQKYVVTGGKGFHHQLDALLMFEPAIKKDLKFYSEVKGIDGKDIQIGHYVNVKMESKCRLGPPHRRGRFKLIYARGIVDTHEETIEMAKKFEILTTKGSNFYLGEEKLANSNETLYAAVLQNAELRDKLSALVGEKLK